MEDRKARRLVRYSMFIALVTIATIIIKIPSPATKGYINLGDSMVILSGFLLGPRGGFLVGGLGSGLADLISGYGYYVPITFIVKGLEGFLVGYLSRKPYFRDKKILVAGLGGFLMVVGYYLFQLPLYGAKAGLVSIPGNIIQASIGGMVALGLLKYVKLNLGF